MIMLLSYFQNINQGPGEGTYTDHTIEIIVMLLVSFILGYLLHYFIGRKWVTLAEERQKRIATLEADLDKCRKRSNDLEEGWSKSRYDYERLREVNGELRSNNADLDIQLRACQEQLSNDEASGEILAASAIAASIDEATPSTDDNRIRTGYAGTIDYKAAFENDNLQVIEGIGPKTEALLKQNGIENWKDLADTPVSRLSTLLSDNKMAFANPDTWPRQAAYADAGQWDELIAFQKDYDPNSNSLLGDTNAKAEQMAARILGISFFKENDLKVIEGIGPKIESLLHNDGIRTWQSLANASVEHLQNLLDKAGKNFKLADPGTWPTQAGMAARGEWQELWKYQEELDGGK